MSRPNPSAFRMAEDLQRTMQAILTQLEEQNNRENRRERREEKDREEARAAEQRKLREETSRSARKSHKLEVRAQRKRLSEKLSFLSDLSNLSQVYIHGSFEYTTPMASYLLSAEQILRYLGPEYDGEVSMAVLRGLKNKELGQQISMLLHDQSYDFKKIKNMLLAAEEYNTAVNAIAPSGSVYRRIGYR